MMNEGFGKKWIDKILGKVDKDQGVANAGKVLGIGADGIVTPVEQTGGGGTFTPWTETVKIADIATMVGQNKLKIGDILSYHVSLYYLKTDRLTGVNIGTVEAPVYVLEGSPSIFNFGTTVRKTIYSITDSSILFTDPNFTDISTNDSTVNIEGASTEIYYTDLVFHEDMIYSITNSRFESTMRYELTTGNKASPRILSYHTGAWIGSYVSSGDATITHMS